MAETRAAAGAAAWRSQVATDAEREPVECPGIEAGQSDQGELDPEPWGRGLCHHVTIAAPGG